MSERSPSPLRALAASALPALFLLLAPAPVHAEPTAVRLDYEAAPGCPTVARFVDEIARRTKLARAATPGETALEVRVRLVSNGPGTTGSIRTTRHRGGAGAVCRRGDVRGGRVGRR